MKIHLATDHAGFNHKEIVRKFLQSKDYQVIDHGNYIYDDNDDYPDFVTPAAEAVAQDPESMGILFGYSGQGEAMTANKIKGVRAVAFYGGSEDILSLSRDHNNANILSIGANFVPEDKVCDAVIFWMLTPFSGSPRHKRRIEKF